VNMQDNEAVGDTRLLDYMEAANRGDMIRIQEIVGQAIQDKDLLILRRFVTINVMALFQLRITKASLQVTQRELKGLKTYYEKEDSKGTKIIVEALKHREALGQNYIEYPWTPEQIIETAKLFD
jgi:hypothetical protein